MFGTSKCFWISDIRWCLWNMFIVINILYIRTSYAIVLLQVCVSSMLLRHLGSAGHFRHSTFGRITFQEMDTYHIPPGVKKNHQKWLRLGDMLVWSLLFLGWLKWAAQRTVRSLLSLLSALPPCRGFISNVEATLQDLTEEWQRIEVPFAPQSYRGFDRGHWKNHGFIQFFMSVKNSQCHRNKGKVASFNVVKMNEDNQIQMKNHLH